MSNNKGLSLLEVIVSITFLMTVISMIGVSLSSFTLQLRSLDENQAVSFAKAQLEALEAVEFIDIPVGLDQDFFGFAYNHGRQTIRENLTAPSVGHVLSVEAGPLLDRSISSIVLLQDFVWESFTLEYYLMISPVSEASWQTGPVFTYRDHNNFAQFRFSSSNSEFVIVQNGIEQVLYSQPASYSPNQWYKLSVTSDGAGQYIVEVNDSLWAVVNDSTFSAGRVGNLSYNNSSLEIDSVSLTMGGTIVYSFENEPLKEFPVGFLAISPTNFKGGVGRINVEIPVDQPSAKEITAKVSWNSRSTNRNSQVKTILYEPFE